MSEWITPKIEDIDLSEDGNEIHIFVEQDEFGARYISIEKDSLNHLYQLLTDPKYPNTTKTNN